MGPHVEAVEGSESVSAESAGPVSAPTSLSLPARGPPSSGSHGVLGSAGPSLVGVSALGYPSGQADPRDSSMYTVGQMSTSLVTGTARAEVHAESELERSSYSTSLRQPPPPRRLPLKVLQWRSTTIDPRDAPSRCRRVRLLAFFRCRRLYFRRHIMLNCRSQFHLVGDELLRRSVLCRSVHLVCRLARVRLATGHLAPIGSDIEAEYPAARPSVFQPSLVDTSVDRVHPVAARADVGRMSLPYASVDVGGPRPAVVATQVALMSRLRVHMCARS